MIEKDVQYICIELQKILNLGIAMKVSDSREASYIVQIKKYLKKPIIIIMKFPQPPYTDQLYTFPQIQILKKP